MNDAIPMIECRLYAKDGGYVATVTIPRFMCMPEVLVWGARVFQWRESGDEAVYVEAFAWFATDRI